MDRRSITLRNSSLIATRIGRPRVPFSNIYRLCGYKGTDSRDDGSMEWSIGKPRRMHRSGQHDPKIRHIADRAIHQKWKDGCSPRSSSRRDMETDIRIMMVMTAVLLLCVAVGLVLLVWKPGIALIVVLGGLAAFLAGGALLLMKDALSK
jgi:hypothetical protein